MDISDLHFRVARLIEWHRFERGMLVTLESSNHFKRELKRVAPNNRPLSPADWSLLSDIWFRLHDSQAGFMELMRFMTGLQYLNQPLDGKAAIDFNASMQSLRQVDVAVDAALSNGNVDGVRTQSSQFDQQLMLLTSTRREWQESELGELRQLLPKP